MDLGALEGFLAVARHRSFTLAARERQMTQPGLSRLVRRLEHQLHATLFDRRRDALVLTPAGLRLRAYAEEVLQRYSMLLQEVRSLQPGLTGDLRIATSSTPGEFMVPDLVARFAAAHPEVQPEVFASDSVEVMEKLLERQWDVGFVGIALPRAELEFTDVAEDRVVLAVSASHPFAGRDEVSLRDLDGQPFLEREGGSGTRLSFRSGLEYRGLPVPKYRVAMVLNSTHAIIAAVRKAYGIGLVSCWAIDPQDTQVRAVQIRELPPTRPLYLVTEKRRVLSPAAKSFVVWVTQQAPYRWPEPERMPAQA